MIVVSLHGRRDEHEMRFSSSSFISQTLSTSAAPPPGFCSEPTRVRGPGGGRVAGPSTERRRPSGVKAGGGQPV